MTPDIQAAAERIRAFLDARDRWNEGLTRQPKHIAKFPHPTIVSETFASLMPEDLRLLLAALDPAEQLTRHAPLTDDTSGAHITPAGRAAVLDYKAIRREQNPRQRLGGGPS